MKAYNILRMFCEYISNDIKLVQLSMKVKGTCTLVFDGENRVCNAGLALNEPDHFDLIILGQLPIILK